MTVNLEVEVIADVVHFTQCHLRTAMVWAASVAGATVGTQSVLQYAQLDMGVHPPSPLSAVASGQNPTLVIYIGSPVDIFLCGGWCCYVC